MPLWSCRYWLGIGHCLQPPFVGPGGEVVIWSVGLISFDWLMGFTCKHLFFSMTNPILIISVLGGFSPKISLKDTVCLTAIYPRLVLTASAHFPYFQDLFQDAFGYKREATNRLLGRKYNSIVCNGGGVYMLGYRKVSQITRFIVRNL